MSADELVVTGLGAVTAAAIGSQAHWDCFQHLGKSPRSAEDYGLAQFKATEHVRDRRQLKSVSHADGIGLSAINGLITDSGYQVGYYSSERIGVYVGAAGATVADNDGYMDALIAATGPNGQVSSPRFGKTSTTSRPVTLLVGLANNVLCYGSLLLDARGPNSNYVSSSTSAHLALINAAKRLARGQIDMAVAGGYSLATDPANAAMFKKLGLLREEVAEERVQDNSPNNSPNNSYALRPFQSDAPAGTILADGAAFVIIERRAAATARGAKVLAQYCGGAIGSDGLGPKRFDPNGVALIATITRALSAAGISSNDIGLVLSGASGVKAVDQVELRALRQIFNYGAHSPALAVTSRVLGNLLEAGGIIELALVSELYKSDRIPESISPDVALAPFQQIVNRAKPYALVLRSSPWGEYSCVVVKREVV